MVSSKSGKIFHFIIFLLPAVLLYSMFFVKPLYKGVGYFTDWNGIVPEVQLEFEKDEFENNVIGKLNKKSEIEYIKQYYLIDDYNEYYELTTFIEIPGQDEERPISVKKKAKLKKILKKVGINPIKFIGFKNYIDMFKNDERFVPRINKNNLFKKFKPLPESIEKSIFEKNLIKNIKTDEEKKAVIKYYKFGNIKDEFIVYSLKDSISKEEKNRLKKIINTDLSKLEKKKLTSKVRKNSLFSAVPQYIDQDKYETYFIKKNQRK